MLQMQIARMLRTLTEIWSWRENLCGQHMGRKYFISRCVCVYQYRHVVCMIFQSCITTAFLHFKCYVTEKLDENLCDLVRTWKVTLSKVGIRLWRNKISTQVKKKNEFSFNKNAKITLKCSSMSTFSFKIQIPRY